MGTARREVAALAIILFAWLTVNLLSASRSPTVWMDEVQCTDAPLTLLQGHGFRSAAFEYQSRDRILPWPSIAHAAAVYGMMRVFGFDPTAVRATNYVLVAGAVLLIYAALRRSGLVRHARVRQLWLVVLLCGYGLTFSYRSARYDMAGFMALSIGVFGLSCSAPWRSMLVFASGALALLSGIQLLPFAFLVTLGLWLPYRWKVVAPALTFGAGVMAGTMVLYLLFRHFGIWGDFLHVIRYFSPHERLATRLVEAYHPQDISSVLLFVSLLVLVAWSWKSRKDDGASPGAALRSAAGLGLLAYGLIDLGMSAAGRFPVYYTWMLYLPLSLCLAVALDRLWEQPGATRPRRIALALAAAACLVGLPARLGLTAMQWSGRDYGLVRQFVAANVHGGDSVFSDWQAFYALRARNDVETFFPDYEPRLTSVERAHLTELLVTDDDSGRALVSKIGGSWRIAARMSEHAGPRGGLLARVSARPYGNLVVYRRSGADATP